MPSKLIVPALGLIAVLSVTPWFVRPSQENSAVVVATPVTILQTVIATVEAASASPLPARATATSRPFPSRTANHVEATPLVNAGRIAGEPKASRTPAASPPPKRSATSPALSSGAVSLKESARPDANSPEPTIASRPAPPATLNGVPLSRVVVMSSGAGQRVREISARGQTLGRNGWVLSKVGDSTMAYPPFLAAFDGRGYRLGAYAYLQGAIDRFAGSFARESIAVRVGMHTWSEFDPKWANTRVCRSAEGPLACELRLNNPSVAIIRLGANDVSSPNLFEAQLRKIVDLCIAQGVIPILGTKPDRLEGEANTLNRIVRQIASAYHIPLWDYDWIAATVPGRGLEKDGVHMRGGGTHDYVSPRAFQSGDSLEDLTALMMLDAVLREIAPLKAR